MRISDWSSDVCSSDLGCSTSTSARRWRKGSPRAQRDGRNGSTESRQRTSLKCRRMKISCVSCASPAKRSSDRKSVVEGKSVSVSVDLGGRRIIKKKKQTSRHHRHEHPAHNTQQ